MSPVPSPTSLRHRLARVLFSPAGLLCGFVVLLIVMCPGARAVPVLEETVLSNFTAVADFNDGVQAQVGASGTENRWFAQGFTTGSYAQWNRVQAIDLGLNKTPGAVTSASVQLYTSSSGAPGSLVDTFSLVSGSVSSLATYRFVASTGTVLLSDSTPYWVVVSDTAAGSGSNFAWAITDSAATPTGSVNYGPYTWNASLSSNNGGSTWLAGTPLTNGLTLQVVAVPEPSTIYLAAFGLVSAEVVRRARRRKTRADMDPLS